MTPQKYKLVGLASNFIVEDELIPVNAKKNTSTPKMWKTSVLSSAPCTVLTAVKLGLTVQVHLRQTSSKAHSTYNNNNEHNNDNSAVVNSHGNVSERVHSVHTINADQSPNIHQPSEQANQPPSPCIMVQCCMIMVCCCCHLTKLQYSHTEETKNISSLN